MARGRSAQVMLAGRAVVALGGCSAEMLPLVGASEAAVPPECGITEPYLDDLRDGISMLAASVETHGPMYGMGDADEFDRLGDTSIGVSTELEGTDFDDVSRKAHELVGEMDSVSMGTNAESRMDRTLFQLGTMAVLASFEGVRCDSELAERRETEHQQREDAEQRRDEFLDD